MDFDQIIVKESPGLCRCCLSEGCYKDLGSEYTWMCETEIYADMLLECFDISISQHNEGPNGANRLICEVCITRLRDACNFKKQVMDSEKKFVDMVGRGEFQPKVMIYQTPMKTESLVEESMANDGDVEYLDEELDFGDDLPLNDSEDISDDMPISTLKARGKRGRPKKTATAVKAEKKAKVPKLDDKPRTSKAVAKGEKRLPLDSTKPMTATKRNRLIKRNTIIVLEQSTVIPFKWHRHDYLCFYCHRSFKDTDLLKNHTKTQHKKSSIKSAVSYLRRDEKVKIDVTVILCRVCETKFEDIDTLIDHLKVSHKKKISEDCGYGIIPYRLNNESFQCAICEERFQYFIKLNQHMNKHFGSYICELCGKSFLSHARLRCHSIGHRSGFRCNECPETFESLSQKITHESKMHKKLKCLYCQETFPNYNVRKKHHRDMHNVDMAVFNCPVCTKSFLVMSRMKVHLREVHMKEKNFSCTMCEQKFFSRTLVQKHMVKHLGERVHQCSVCKKEYARKQTLRDHMRTHGTEKRFICAVCCQGFVQNNGLRLHMRVHHPDAVSA